MPQNASKVLKKVENLKILNSILVWHRSFNNPTALLFKQPRHLRDGKEVRPDGLRNLAPTGDDLREF